MRIFCYLPSDALLIKANLWGYGACPSTISRYGSVYDGEGITGDVLCYFGSFIMVVMLSMV